MNQNYTKSPILHDSSTNASFETVLFSKYKKQIDQCNIIPKKNDSWGSRAFKQSVYKDKLTIWLIWNFLNIIYSGKNVYHTSKIKIIVALEL